MEERRNRRIVEAIAMISVGRGTKSMPNVEQSYKNTLTAQMSITVNVKRDVLKHLKPFNSRKRHTLSSKEIESRVLVDVL